jgi:hypothetical protein
MKKSVFKILRNPRKSVLSVFSTFFLIAAMMFSFACANLDLPSDGRLTFDEIFANYTLTKNFYNSSRGYIPAYGLEYSNSTPLASYCDEAHDADDTRSGTGVNAWYNDRTSPFSNPLAYNLNWWDHLFQGIRKCNTFLACINDPELATAKISEEEKNGWIAEVRVTRAFYYLQLIKRYGGAPIIETPYELKHDFSQNRRPTFEECADFIIADCDAALAMPEPESSVIGFRWNISDMDRGRMTRGVAWAIKSQTALYAASPLWFTSGSKYTWEYAAAITKEALDQCLAHGYELYDTPVDADVAQSPYAYYFIQRSDPSRSRDKETIYESVVRTNVWRHAGTPITPGMVKAGAGPTQELVDSYEMQATGELPILGYSDADRLIPIINNPASGYDPENPYVGRDPRFDASIYYNGSQRSFVNLETLQRDIFPLEFDFTTDTFEDNAQNIDVTHEDGYVVLRVIAGDPYIYVKPLGSVIPSVALQRLTFEYKSNRAVNNCKIYWLTEGNTSAMVAEVGNRGTITTNIEIPVSPTEWRKFELDITYPYSHFHFGKSEDDLFRFNLMWPGTPTQIGYEISIRKLQIETVEPPMAPTPVETFVNGNCGISNRVTDTRFTRTGYYLRKFNNYRSGNNVDGDGFMKIFRLGELYMNFAEAAYQAYGADAPVNSTVAGGSAMTARQAVNAIRARADMPLLLEGMSKTEFEKRYRNERRVEFAFEEHRFFDVRRWKILNETDNFVTGMRITQSGDEFIYNRFKFPERNTDADKYLMFPLSQSEAAIMEELTGVSWQNPGW